MFQIVYSLSSGGGSGTAAGGVNVGVLQEAFATAIGSLPLFRTGFVEVRNRAVLCVLCGYVLCVCRGQPNFLLF